jgi:hypothetical protein
MITTTREAPADQTLDREKKPVNAILLRVERLYAVCTQHSCAQGDVQR